MLTFYIILFFLFSVFGWILDSTYSSIVERKWVNRGYFAGPLCPVYGVSTILLFHIFNYNTNRSLLAHFLIAGTSMVLLEYAAGVFSLNILKTRLWDYSKAKFHISGHIDLLHSTYWFILLPLFYFVFYPQIRILKHKLVLESNFDMIIAILFALGLIYFTVKKHTSSVLKKKDDKHPFMLRNE